MASAPEPVLEPPQNPERFVTTIHGNCVFSDAVQPVKIDHLANGAVVGPVDGKDIGVIHFTLPMVLHSGPEQNPSVIERLGLLERLEVDFAQVQGSTQQWGRPSEVIKAEIFIGCT